MSLLALPFKTASHPDGRSISYAEFGDPAGRPVIYLHGSPGSRLDWGIIGAEGEARLKQYGLRLIAPDRPGIGQSDPQPKRRIVDHVDDLRAIMDAENLQTFGLLGISAGSPYLLHAALTFADRVTKVVMGSGVAPFDIPGLTEGMGASKTIFRMASSLPPLVSMQYAMLKRGLKSDRAKVITQAKKTLPPPDAAALDRPDVANGFLDTFTEALRQGARHLTYDNGLTVQPWGFDIAAVRAPVHIFHGTADRNAPVAMARYYADTLPRAALSVKEGEGHFSLSVNHIDEMLAVLGN